MKHIYIIIFIFFGQVISAQDFTYNDVKMHAVLLDECYKYLLEKNRKVDTLFIIESRFFIAQRGVRHMYEIIYGCCHMPIYNSRVVFINYRQFAKFAKEKTKNRLFDIGIIQFVDKNNFMIKLVNSKIIKERDKETKKRYFVADDVGAYYFFLRYSEVNNKWEIIDVKFRRNAYKEHKFLRCCYLV